LIYGIIFGALFAALVWWNIPVFVALMGATGETAGLAEHYLAIIIPTLPLLLTGMMGGAILRAHGDARRAMTATIVGGLVNAVLDPILIFGFDLELTGAAIATVMARVAIAAVSLLPILKHYGGFTLPTPGSLLRDIRPILAIALPAILTQMATPVGQAYVTRAMAEYGEAAVAGMAIIGRLTPLAFAVIFALSGAVGPIIGQNYGAQQNDRVIGAFNAALKFTAMFVIAMAILLYLLRDLIAAVFTADGITVQLLYLFCGPLALLWFFNGMIFVANSAFNNLGHPYYSTWINWGRNTLGTIPLVTLCAWLFGAPGVLVGQALGGVVFGLAAYWLARRVMVEASGPVERTPFQRQGRLMSLLLNRH
jgi:putative MATE family efflux protein